MIWFFGVYLELEKYVCMKIYIEMFVVDIVFMVKFENKISE